MSENNIYINWKTYEDQTRTLVDQKIEQMEKDGKDTSGNLANKLTTKMNIGATKESTIVGAGHNLAHEMNEALGKNAVSYDNTTNPFSNLPSMSFNGNQLEEPDFLETIIQFFLVLFGLNDEKTNSIGQAYQRGEIRLDRDKDYQIVGINKDLHSTAVMVDNVNKLVVGYDPNGNFNPNKFYNLLTHDDLAYLKSNGYQFVNANRENKNKGTFTGMCGVLTTDWIEQELKTKLDERKNGITRYNNMEQIEQHYALVNKKNNPDVNRMMARNRVHFLMSKGENIETLKQYNEQSNRNNEQNTIKISNILQTNAGSISTNITSGSPLGKTKDTKIMIGSIQTADNNSNMSANVVQANCQNNQQGIAGR